MFYQSVLCFLCLSTTFICKYLNLLLFTSTLLANTKMFYKFQNVLYKQRMADVASFWCFNYTYMQPTSDHQMCDNAGQSITHVFSQFFILQDEESCTYYPPCNTVPSLHRTAEQRFTSRINKEAQFVLLLLYSFLLHCLFCPQLTIYS